jgi:hypothetical protein
MNKKTGKLLSCSILLFLCFSVLSVKPVRIAVNTGSNSPVVNLNASAGSQAPVDLGTAGSFAILAKSGISTTGNTSIVGDIGVSPIDSTGITGFGLIMDPSNQSSTSSLVTGQVYASNYASPTPSDLSTAVSDMQTAYTNAAGRTLPDQTELGSGNIGGMTLAPGLYKWSSGVTIPTNVTLSGNSTSVWIFQIDGTLTVSSAVHVVLTSGAQANNVFWQVAGQTTLGSTAAFKGIILCYTAIVMNTGVTLNGSALAQTEVTLDTATVTISPPSSGSPSPLIGLPVWGSLLIIVGVVGVLSVIVLIRVKKQPKIQK